MREHYQTKKCPRCIGPVQIVDNVSKVVYFKKSIRLQKGECVFEQCGQPQ